MNLSLTSAEPWRRISRYTVIALTLAMSYAGAIGSQAAVQAGSDPNSATVIEQVGPSLVSPSFEISSSAGFAGKYIQASLDAYSSSDQLSLAQDSAVSNELNTVSIVNNEVWVGKGDGTAERVGQVDATDNGNGRALKINFVSSFANAGFEDATTISPWTAYPDRVNLGVTVLAGFQTYDAKEDTDAYPRATQNQPKHDNNTPTTAGTFTVQNVTEDKFSGTRSLRLRSSGVYAPGHSVIHGPAAWSEVFPGSQGQELSFAWRANAGGDNYHVWAALLRTDGNFDYTQRWTEILYRTGNSTTASTTWTRSKVVIPDTGTYRFVFVSGSQDYNGGTLLGATLYVDDVQVLSSSVPDLVAQAVARRISYLNTSDAPVASRVMTIAGVNELNEAFSSAITINITAVDDDGSASNSAVTFVNSLGNTSFATLSGTISAFDPDGDSLGLFANSATADPITHNGVTYDYKVSGALADLYLDAYSLKYIVVPKSAALNAVEAPTFEDFEILVITSGTEDIDIPVQIRVNAVYDMKPGAPGISSIESVVSSDQKTVTYTVTMDELVQNFDAAAISLSGTSVAASNWVKSEPVLTPGTTRYVFTVTSANPVNGTLDFVLSTSRIVDFAATPNALPNNNVAGTDSSLVRIEQFPTFEIGPDAFIGGSGSTISPSFQLNSYGSGIAALRISIDNPTTSDALQFTAGSGFSVESSNNNTVLIIRAANTVADSVWQAAIRSVRFTTNSTAMFGRKITYHITPEKGYDFVGGTFFRAVGVSPDVQYSVALNKASEMKLYGLQGYLATPTTPSQQAAMLLTTPVNQSWLGIGGVARQNNTQVKILVGPGAGSTVNYAPCASWNQGDSSPNPGVIHISTINSCWNDLGVNDYATHLKGFVVEFGGSPGDPELLVTKSHTITPDLSNPFVTRVSAQNGDYSRGQAVLINVRFNEAVVVSGSGTASRLDLGSGRFAEYVSGSGTNTLVYRYVVQGSDDESDLDYVSTASLTAQSMNIKDLAGNAAILTLPAPGATGSLAQTSNVDLSGDVFRIEFAALAASTTSQTVLFSLSATENLNCSTLASSDFNFSNLSSASFAVTPQGPSTSCIISVDSTVGAASFGTSALTLAPGFSVSDVASPTPISFVRNQISVGRTQTIVTRPAVAGQGEVLLDERNLNRSRPSNVIRNASSGLLPNAPQAAKDALAARNVIAPPPGSLLPELVIRGLFDQLNLVSDEVDARKRQVIRAGDVVRAGMQITASAAADFKVVSYLDFNSGWLFAGEQDFDQNGQVDSDALVFTQPGEYVLRMYVVPKSATAGIQYPITPLALQRAFLPAFGFNPFGFNFRFFSSPTLTQAQLESINSKQNLELVLVIEAGDQVPIQEPLSTTPPPVAPIPPVMQPPVEPVLPTPEVTPEPEALNPEPAPVAPVDPPAAPAPAAPDAPSEPPTEPEPEPTPEPEAEPEQAEEIVAAPVTPEPEATLVLESYDPFGSPEAIKETTALLSAFAAIGALAAAAGAAAAAAAAAGAAGSAAASGSSGGLSGAEMSEDSLDALAGADFELDVFADSKDRWGDKLALWAIPILSFLDKPTHNATRRVARYSPLVSKLLNDGSYLRAMLGSVSLLPTIAAIVLAVIGLTQNQDILLHPPVGIFIAILVIGLFDSFAGAMGVLVFILGSLPLVDAGEITDWRMLSGIAVAGFGPILLARSIRNFRRKAPRDASGWLDRIGDIGFASLMGGWISGLVLRALPALTGLAVPAADYVFEVQVIATIAIAVRILLEDLAARFYPSRMDDLTPDTLPEPFKFQPALVMVFRYLFYVFIASAFMGLGVIVLIASALFLVPNLLGLITDKLPRVEFLTKWLPSGLPAIAMILGLEIVLENTLSNFFGDHPEFSTIFIFGLLALIIFLTVLGMLARPEPNQPHWLQAPNKQAIYRIGGFVTFLLLVWFTSQL